MTGYRLCPLPLGNALADLVGRYGVVEVGEALRGLYPHAWPLTPEPTPDLATLTADARQSLRHLATLTASVDLNATSVDRLAARVDALALRLDADHADTQIDAATRRRIDTRRRALANTRSLYSTTICGEFRSEPDALTQNNEIDNWPCVRPSGHDDDHGDAARDEWPRVPTRGDDG